jgi:hydrogenase expression/formation protein HypC
MCMSRPGRVLQVRDGMAEVEINGRVAWFNALTVPDVKPGAWVLTHTSIVLDEISADDAREIDRLFQAGMEVPR